LPRSKIGRSGVGSSRPAPAVVGIGETLVRLAPRAGETLETAPELAVHIGGTESNVCAALAHLGVRTAWISRLPATPLGRRIATTIRGYGVDIEGVLWAPDGRVGLMLVQPGAGPRAGEVLYYRRDSAFAGIDPDAVDWTLLTRASVVHLTGITPALGTNASRLVSRAMAEARRRKVRISFDVNYRAKLWSPRAARNTIEPLLRGLDIVILNDRDASAVFGERGDPEKIARALRSRFRCGVLVLTRGALGALAVDRAGTHRQQAYPTEIIDRIGRGDAFAAGFLYGFLARDSAEGLRYGAAMAALKQTYRGDVCLATPAAVEVVFRGESGAFHR
jgi:2-dehydro-3-deoxygluconokinase